MVKKFLYAVSFVFALVAIAHLLRFVNGTEMTVGTWDVPMLVSVVGFVLYKSFKSEEQPDDFFETIKPFNPIRLSPSTNNLRSGKKQS